MDESIKAGDPLTISVTVSIVGKQAGDEVIQVYMRDVVASIRRTDMGLKAIKRVTLIPG